MGSMSFNLSYWSFENTDGKIADVKKAHRAHEAMALIYLTNGYQEQ
jgi:hypothetical protein